MRSTCARNDYESGIELVATSDNVVMRARSRKSTDWRRCGSAGCMRPRYVVDAINRTRGPFNVNAPAIAAGVAALSDTAHVEHAARAQRHAG